LFLYDGWNVVKEIATENGQPPTDKYYVWGLDLSQSNQGAGGIGGLLTSVEGSLTHYFYYDGNGNVGQLVNVSDGSISAHYEYDPFGNTIVANGAETDNNTYRFSTKYFDVKTEFYYYGYRYYSPQFGRWINRDVISESGGINLYAFAQNNAISAFDVFGLWVEPDQIITPSESVSIIQRIESMHKENRSKFGAIFVNNSLLFYIGFEVSPGAEGRGNNRFVFTCKYGWIDMGHFFLTAGAGSVLGSDKAYKVGLKMEEIQKKALNEAEQRGGGMAESAYTPEDLFSNLLGSKFGDEVSRDTNITGKWNKFLKFSGAIKFSTPDVNETLQKDVKKLWKGTIYIGERFETPMSQLQYQRKTLEAFCLYCDGDEPKKKYKY
jgi:RHS repeat-associated protein